MGGGVTLRGRQGEGEVGKAGRGPRAEGPRAGMKTTSRFPSM